VVDTTQDEKVEDPASIVYYDDFLDPDNPSGVVCARGVCVLPDDEDIDWSKPPGAVATEEDSSIVDKFLKSYLGPRLLLAFASILYGTNFPLGAMMNEALPPSAATSARMLLASLALSPFLFKLEPKLAPTALLCGCFTALGYITQSLSLVDTSPAKVAFIGAAVVIVCPTLEVLVNKKDLSLTKAPQVWLAATLCMVGVGVLELYDPTGATALSDVFSQIGFGDFLAFLQAVGFGTSFFITERMMTEVPGQALPITAVQVSVSAFLCMVWVFIDGWVGTAGADSYGMPAMFFEPSLQLAAGAVAWTGLITTALNRFIETTALGKMKSAEASVILATEPLWASLFAALWLNENFGANDYIGGALIVGACLATALKRDDFKFLLGDGDDDEGTTGAFE
jgi:drug/metabolite transporter (DMT)-like permease